MELSREDRWNLLLVLTFSIFAVTPLLKPGFPASDDMLAPVYRLMEMDVCIRDGVLFPRWFPDLYGGRGAPFFNYYAPLAYYAGEIFHVLGIGLANSVKAAYGASFILSGLFMYLLVRGRTSPSPALVAAVLYMYAPYRFMDIYVRGALGESFTFVLFPLILLFLEQGSRNPVYYPPLALSYGALVLTHNIMALVFTAFLAVYWLVLCDDRRLPVGVALIGGLGLSAFFWLPALAEKGLVQIERVVLGFRYVSPVDLLPSVSTFTQRQPGLNPEVGIFHILALLAGLTLLKDRYGRFIGAGSVLLIFFMTPYSAPLWALLPLSEYVQFSWRLLAILAFTTSILGGLVTERLGMSKKVAILLCFLVVLFSFNFIGLRGTIDHGPQDLTPEALRQFNDGLTYAGEYMPRDAVLLPPREEKVMVLEGQALLQDIRAGCGSLALETVSQEGASVLVNIYYFPGWTAYIDGDEVPLEKGEYGLMALDIPLGRHQVLLRLEDTPVRRMANLLSLASFLFLLGFALKPFLGQYAPRRHDPGG